MTDFFNFSIKYSEKLENEGCVREQFEKCTSEKKREKERNKEVETKTQRGGLESERPIRVAQSQRDP